MNATTDNQVSVLVVGAGSVGLVLVCEFARRGARIRLIERSQARSEGARGQIRT